MIEPTPKLMAAIRRIGPFHQSQVEALCDLIQACEQAAREDALEQAARVADEFLLRRGGWNSYHQDAQLEIARKIRALPAAESKEPRG